MSFLNPVNEPVLRFKSTDAGAPQIDYNARVAGDVKAVLKACLVTGYGATASAGWSVVNEVGHVAEFVSPSAAMSDYRLGVDDTSTSSTTWYYQYQNVRVNPLANQPKKSISSINKTHASNGWQLFTTPQAILLIEIVYNNGINQNMVRATYLGSLKSAVPNTIGKNIAFWNTGIAGQRDTFNLFSTASSAHLHAVIEGYTAIGFDSSLIRIISDRNKVFDTSSVDVIDGLILSQGSLFIAKHPAITLRTTNNIEDIWGLQEVVVDSRPMLKVCLGYENGSLSFLQSYCIVMLISTDYWEF